MSVVKKIKNELFPTTTLALELDKLKIEVYKQKKEIWLLKTKQKLALLPEKNSL